jgi:hypothetical protein
VGQDAASKTQPRFIHKRWRPFLRRYTTLQDKMTRESTLDNLKKTVEHFRERGNEFLENKNGNDVSHIFGYLGTSAFYYAIHAYFVDGNIKKAKDYFNLHGKYKLRESQLSKAESIIRVFWVGRTLICNVGISDNKNLIDIFAQHNYPIKYNTRGKDVVTDFKSFVRQGDESIYSELMLNALNKDLETLHLNLEIFQKKTLIKAKNAKMTLDLNFYKSLLSGNRTKIESSICAFLTKTEHKYRNQHDAFPELISYPAVGYIKIALLNGIDISIDHEFIPMSLLKIEPLENYSDIIEIK